MISSEKPKLPRIRVSVIIERYYGASTINKTIQIACSDPEQVDRVADMLTGIVSTEKMIAEKSPIAVPGE